MLHAPYADSFCGVRHQAVALVPLFCPYPRIFLAGQFLSRGNILAEHPETKATYNPQRHGDDDHKPHRLRSKSCATTCAAAQRNTLQEYCDQDQSNANIPPVVCIHYG